MATGPDHYREAERLLAEGGYKDRPEINLNLLAALVHATLADAAATALAHYSGDGMPGDDRAAWLACASEAPAANARRREAEREEQAEFEAGLITEARGWIADCQWVNIGPDDVAELTDDQVRAGIENYFTGGWTQFTQDNR